MSEHLASMISLRPPGRRTIDVGPQPAVLGVDRHFGLEIGVGLRPACSSTLLRLCSPQRPRALGDERKRVDQVAGLVADLALAGADQLDRLAQAGIMVDPLLLDLLQPFLVALERGLDRLQQCLELGCSLVAWVKRLAGLVEEILVRLRRAICRRSRGTARPGFPWPRVRACDLLLERALALVLRGLEARRAPARPTRCVALLDDRVELEPEVFRDRLARPPRRAAADQPADQAAERQARGQMNAITPASIAATPAEHSANFRRRRRSAQAEL